MKSLTAFGSRLQLPSARVQAMAEEERKTLYQQAKQALASK